VRAPVGAPNIVVILVDDLGFGASSAFGGPCEMPAAERLAQNGLRYTRFHTTAICSPTRAALLTGRNHHTVGFGWINQDAGRPGYDCSSPRSAASIARVLALNGYATGAFGKWHQTPASELTGMGPFERWPTGQGFEKFYGFQGGQTSQWEPEIFDGTARVEQPRSPQEGYHLSEDLVDQSIGWFRGVLTLRPECPFFCYLSFGATHEPLHVERTWAERYRGRFDHGWNAQRELTLERQKALGIVPQHTELAPWAETLPQWQELGRDEQRAACALMELFAGFTEHMDAQVGRLVDALEALDVLDNTLIFYILGDNGASGEGAVQGTANMIRQYNGLPSSAAEILAQADALGGPETWPQYPAGWALAMDSPYQWMKRVASHYGGTRNGLIVHWPDGIESNGLRHQWHHVIDVAPTLLAAARLPQPAIVDGVAQIPIDGTAMNYSFDDAEAPDRHTTQYFEVEGSRGIYHEGWVACTPHRTRPWDLIQEPTSLREDVWELYDTRQDWSQARNVADAHPEKLQQLQELFLIEAARHDVLPIDSRPPVARRAQVERAMQRRSTTLCAGTRLPHSVAPEVASRSHTIAAQITVPQGGAAGVICAQGSRASGWMLYCIDTRVGYCHNVGTPPHFHLRAGEPLSAGPHQVVYEFVYDGGGHGMGGTGALLIDGEKVAEGRAEQTVRAVFQVGLGVGVGFHIPVCDEIPGGANAFTGEIECVRIELGAGIELDSADRARLEIETQ
jgi:arylsulfatase A-like enzyme